MIKKHAPEIILGASVTGVVVSTVMACKATLKMSDIVDEAKEDIDEIKSTYEANDDVDEKEYRKALTSVYVKTAVEVGKAYAPSVVLGGLSLGGIYGSNKIQRKRNASLAAAYATLDQSYKQYRKSVIEQIGEDAEKKLKYGAKDVEIEETVVDKNGKEKKVKKTVSAVDPTLYSEYARFFDEGCAEWTKSPEYNLTYLKCREAQCNDMLQSRGYLFLNEVYSLLGIMPTKAGQQVGWIYDRENPVGDNFVDFGIYNTYVERNRDFVNGYEPVILLDFNVDGPILSYFDDMGFNSK